LLAIALAGITAALGSALSAQGFDAVGDDRASTSGRSVSRWLLVIGAAAVILLSIELARVHRPYSGSALVNACYGLLLPVALMVVSRYLSVVFQALVVIIAVLGACIVIVAQGAAALVALVVRAMLMTLNVLFHMLCIPGQALRRLGA
ncbi:MAG: hypothetical protein ABW171_12040, partial [Steroidobacter sp.]